MKSAIIVLGMLIVYMMGMLTGYMTSPFSIADCMSHGGWVSANTGECWVEDEKGRMWHLQKPYSNHQD